MTKAKSKSKSKSKTNKKKTRSSKTSTKSKKATSKQAAVNKSKNSNSGADKKTKKEKTKSNKKCDNVKIQEEEIKETVETKKEPETVDVKTELNDNLTNMELMKMDYSDGVVDELAFLGSDGVVKDEVGREEISMDMALEACKMVSMLLNSGQDLGEEAMVGHVQDINVQDINELSLLAYESINTNVSSNKRGKSREKVAAWKQLQNEEVINCSCGYREEDGLMIQCDVCLTWQHALCCGMNDDADVPDNYLCVFCKNPWNVRPSQRYSYARHFLTLSKLPRFGGRTYREDLTKYREEVMKRTFELTADLRSLNRMERSVTAKLSIAEEQDHPKLYMWSANWDEACSHLQPHCAPSDHISIDGPVGEQPIESFDCRLRLLEKIDSDQRDMTHRLSLIYRQLQLLETHDLDRKVEEKNLKRILRMFEKDLKTVATAVAVS